MWEADEDDFGVPWNFSNPDDSDPCIEEWQGLKCDLWNQTIIGLNLSEHNLTGYLSPTTFTGLMNLESIDLKKVLTLHP